MDVKKASAKLKPEAPRKVARKRNNKQLMDASRMYEQQFLQQMVKAMRKTVTHSKLSKPSFGEKIYTEQLDGQFVDNWTKTGGIGLADLIYDQIEERYYSKKVLSKKK